MPSFGLFTDLYELTMAQVYLKENKTGRAVFSLFVRKLPQNRNFLVSCGLETLLELLENFRFSDEDLLYLKSLGKFSEEFLDFLKEFEFKGSLYAIPEGRVIFQNEPIIQIEADLPTAQILETLVINTIHHQTLIASKAVRCKLASKDKKVVDFGLRRAHSLEGGLWASRACYIAGFDGTSNLMAGKVYGIPVVGTMAHSFVMIFPSEEEAFRAFAKVYPENTIFLIDTYDTLEGAKKVVSLWKEGIRAVGVRIDSGDIQNIAREVRRILDEEGLKEVKIFVSGGLDEVDIDKLLSQDVPVDAFGVGTKVVTSSDSPYLDMAYKLVEYEGKPKVKKSPGKETFPYKRQVYRLYEGSVAKMDKVVKFRDRSEGEPLVEKVLEDGRLLKNLGSVKEARERLLEDLSKLPEDLKKLKKASYRVEILRY